MTDLRLSIEETQDAITGTQPTVSKDNLSQPPTLVTEPEPPVLISEQEVMLGTAADNKSGNDNWTFSGELGPASTPNLCERIQQNGQRFVS